jgi:hypothetical protein
MSCILWIFFGVLVSFVKLIVSVHVSNSFEIVKGLGFNEPNASLGKNKENVNILVVDNFSMR